jgi:uncharacterized metal-binding protein
MSDMKNEKQTDCAGCMIPIRERACMITNGKGSRGCPTAGGKGLALQAKKRYEDPVIHEFARQASIQEGECYAGRDEKPYVLHPTKPRIQEICEFAGKMGYARLGLIFCVGLAEEAAIVADILKNHGFEVVSVICKAGAVPKEEISVKDEEKIYIGRHESMCNPILQALIVNEAKTEFNILLGLCVGHDSLFFKHTEAPATVLAVKDRVTGHNPLAAVYLADSYYRRLKK